MCMLNDKIKGMAINELIRNDRVVLIFTIVGAAGGFLYWRFIGCSTGTCPIKSVWYWSTLFGGVIGYLTGSIINDIIIKYYKKKSQDFKEREKN
jgi:hypothetical protein